MSEFARENGELPAALAHLARYYRTEGRAALLSLRKLAPAGRAILFSGMGTSEITPHHVLARLRGLGHACATVDAGEWHHHATEPRAGEAVVLTSQSGESVELRNIVNRHLDGRPYVAITNDPGSTLARTSALTLPLCAGAESSITTKTYTNNLGLLELMTTVLKDPAGLDGALDRLETCARLMETLDSDGVRAAAAALRETPSLAFVGRGPAYVSARQSALTFMEGTRRLTSAFTGGAFNHGPMEAAEPGFAAVVFVCHGATEALAADLAERLSSRGATVVALADGSARLPAAAKRIDIPSAPGADGASLYPLLAARAHNELLAVLTRLCGISVGDFRYGGKVTTTE